MRVDAKPTVGLLAACLLLHCSRTSSALNLGVYYGDREEGSPEWHDMRAVGDSLEHAGHTVSKINRAVVSCCALYHLLTGRAGHPAEVTEFQPNHAVPSTYTMCYRARHRQGCLTKRNALPCQ